MTDDAPLTPREADEALAAEYVLGVLDLAERAEAEARVKRDPAFAAMVAAWETRLGGMNDDFAEAPAPNLLLKIEERLFPKAPSGKAKARFSVLPWLAGAAVAAALALVTIGIVVPPRPEVLAVLQTADRRLAYEVSEFGGSLRVARVAGVPAVAGQVHELWLIGPGQPPVSLGLLERQDLVVLQPAPPAGWIFAVSIEPEGGSPTGQPTGPVILTTKIEA
jgi:anti-sigma-K factor RskA